MKRSLIALTMAFVLVGASIASTAEAGGGGHAGACPGGNAAVDATEVSMVASCFGPQVAHVAVGASLRWVNRDVMPHNVSALGDASQQASVLNPNDAYTLTFREAGTFPYFCSYHPNMMGLVLVGDDASLAKAVVSKNDFSVQAVPSSASPLSYSAVGASPIAGPTLSKAAAGGSGGYGLLTVIGVALAFGAMSAGGTAVLVRRAGSKRDAS